MARDAELLSRAENGAPGCRVYAWDGPWISLGRQQSAAHDLLGSNPVPWVMRPTGGRAVLHGHDVTVGLAVPLPMLVQPGESAERLSRSVRTVYRRLAAPLVSALNACGMPAALAEHTPFSGHGPKSADCFAHISPNDIVDRQTGLKACGCALRLTARAVLVQASIPNGRPLIDPRLVFAQPQPASYRTWDSAPFAEALRMHLWK